MPCTAIGRENKMNKRLTKNIPQTIGGVRALIGFRGIFANYEYEKGRERLLAKQGQQILEREEQPNLASAVAQFSPQ